jgi:hypothetical protein
MCAKKKRVIHVIGDHKFSQPVTDSVRLEPVKDDCDISDQD